MRHGWLIRLLAVLTSFLAISAPTAPMPTLQLAAP